MNDHNRFLVYLYNQAVSKYVKYKERLDKAVRSGRFGEFSRKEKSKIIHRLRKLKAKIDSYRLQLKVAIAAGALALTLTAVEPANAQANLGPFVQQKRSANPLRGAFNTALDQAPVSVDFDMDGDLDVVVGLSDSLVFYKNNGTVTSPKFDALTGPWVSATGEGYPFPWGMFSAGDGTVVPAFVNLDGDADLDLFLGTSNKGFRYFRRETDGSFTEQTGAWNPSATPPTGNPLNNFANGATAINGGFNFAPAFADYDNDGDLDVVFGHDYDWVSGGADFIQIHVIKNRKNITGFNEFETFIETTSPFDVVRVAGIGYEPKPRFVDVDGSGDVDLFVGTEFGEIRFFRSSINGTFTPQIGPWNPTTKAGNPLNTFTFGSNAAVDFVDLDGDTDLDALVFGNNGSFKYEASHIRYLRNDGNFVFTELEGPENPFDGIPATTDNGTQGAIYPAFIDYDLDGHKDVWVTDYFSPVSTTADEASVTLYRNNQTTERFEVSSSFNTSTVAENFPIEVNFDGTAGDDLILTNTDGTILFYRNDGGGSFTFEPTNDLNTKVAATGPIGLAFVDWNSNGLPDAFVGRGTSVEYYQNDGTPGSPTFTQITGTGNPMNGVTITASSLITSADANNDGFVDLFVSSSTGNVRFFVNQGNSLFVEYTAPDGPFNGATSATIGISPAPKMIDIDDDGDKDIFVGNSFVPLINRGIQFFENTNRPPDVVPSTSTLSFTEGEPAKVLDASLSVTEAAAVAAGQGADININKAKVQITGNYANGQDVLSITPNAVFAATDATFDTSTGVLTILKPATITDYQDILRTVKYNNTSTNPSTATRTIKFYVFDHDSTDPRLDAIADGSISVNVIAVGPTTNPPSLTLSSGPITYSGAAMVLDNGIVATDTEASIASGTVSITNFVAGEDELLFTNQNGITGSFNATTGVLSLTGTTTDANYQTALRSIQYRNNATSKTKGIRTISFQLNDGTDPSNTVTLALTIPNQKPVLTLNQTTVTFTGSDLLLDNLVTVTDTDDTNASSASVSITSGFSSAEDQLVFVNQNGITGSFTGGTLSLTGTATYANYQAALRSIVYRNTAPDRTNANRTISWKINDGVIDSDAGTQTLSVPNQVPVMSVAATANYANGTSQLIDNALTLADTDDVTIISAVVTITSGFVSSEDRLLFTNQNGITGSFNTTTGVLTLTGASSKTNYETALRSVAYQNIANSPTAGNRTITFQVNDGQANSASVNSVMVVTSLAPVVASTSNNAFYLSGDLLINNTLTVTDADNTQLNSATVSINNGFVSAEDQLVFSSQNGISGSFSSSTGVLTLTGLSSVANYQTALRSVQYRNTSSNPTTANRVITFAVSDGTNNSNSLAITLGINQPPVVSVQPQTTGAGGSLTLNVGSILSDADNNLDLSTLQISSQEGADISITNGDIVIDYSSVADFQGTDVLTINVCDLAGRCSSQTVNIEVTAGIIVFNGVSPNGDTANDFFKIRFLPPGSHVLIYNRWGDLVFDMPDYDNTNRNRRFEGLNSNGNELTSGTYFYKIETPQGKSLTGYLTLKR